MIDMTALREAAGRRLAMSNVASLASLANRPDPPAEAIQPKSGLVGSTGGRCVPVSGDGNKRPYRLTPEQARAAHGEPWSDRDLQKFERRARRCRDLGIAADDANDLAEQMHLRDICADYRHACIECANHRRRSCRNHLAAELTTPEVGRDFSVMFQVCRGFMEVIE